MSAINTHITPINSNYETCAECFAYLIVYTGDIHPDIITNILHIKPSSINVKGKKHTNSLGRTREIRTNSWLLTSEGQINSKDIREHIDWILQKIQPAADRLKKVQSLENVKLAVKCVWFSELGHNGPVLWPEQMRGLADLDLECSFDIYFDNFTVFPSSSLTS